MSMPEVPSGEQHKEQEQVLLGLEQVAKITAIAARIKMGDIPESTSHRERVQLIDNAAGSAMAQVLSRLPFGILSVGSEGEKERAKDGLVVGTVIGKFGQKKDTAWIVNDPVEGTDAAADNLPGATSILAASEIGGLIQTPLGVHYMDKLIAPAGLEGEISLEAPWADNLEAIRKHFGAKKEDLLPVVLDRPRNEILISEIRRYQVEPYLIQAGDLLPALAAVVKPQSSDWDPARDKIVIVMGVGGWEEGVISAAAARALGGFVEAQKSTREGDNFDQIFTLDDLVPGKPETTFVTFTPITNDPWFGTKGISYNPVSDISLSYPTVITNKGIKTTPDMMAHSFSFQTLPQNS